jgi:hypothetical protein
MQKFKCFIGPQGGGKDYQCDKLALEGYRKVSFADGIRELAWYILDWKPKNEQEYREFKETALSLFSTLNKLTWNSTHKRYLYFKLGKIAKELDIQLSLDEILEILYTQKELKITGREFLQRLGTDLIRNHVDDLYWTKETLLRIYNTKFVEKFKVCIADTRHLAEIEALLNYEEVEFIWCNYHNTKPTDNHSSEEIVNFLATKEFKHLQPIENMKGLIDEFKQIKQR